jgi:hypothetical protein
MPHGALENRGASFFPRNGKTEFRKQNSEFQRISQFCYDRTVLRDISQQTLIRLFPEATELSPVSNASNSAGVFGYSYLIQLRITQKILTPVFCFLFSQSGNKILTPDCRFPVPSPSLRPFRLKAHPWRNHGKPLL